MPPLSFEKGSPEPLGLSIQGDRTRFAVYSSQATQVFLALFSLDNPVPLYQFPLYRTGSIWHIELIDLPEHLSYAYRCEGPEDETKGLLYNSTQWLADPYAKCFASPRTWNKRAKNNDFVRSPILSIPPFDWQGVQRPQIPKKDLVIYEMHVRGFTQHASSHVDAAGTFLGIISKIPYLKSLGINAIEWMPIFEFDETHSRNIDPQTKTPLPNYWGYNPLHFFVPMARYSTNRLLTSAIEECKTCIRELHRNGIEVFLDVVFNHTGEGKEKDYFIHFRGLDNSTYYLLDEKGEYRDDAGCGNTLNPNHPQVQRFILDCLRYWVKEMQVDGFRFDLASILTRDPQGAPLAHPPLLDSIAQDPLLKTVKLIAEPWDAGGLYQVGLFPTLGPWSEWNGKYRDTVRRFLKGTDGEAGAFAASLCGSEPTYASSKTPLSSINFITAHDGFCLRDLVTYQQKHNYANAEMNRDGSDQNENWNCGIEGPTMDPKILALRERQMRNFLLALFISQGIPMLLMGDEYGHTRKGNNNPYVQDNEINWFLWDELKIHQAPFNFVSSLIAFRKKHAVFRKTHFLKDTEICWHGHIPFHPDWSSSSRFVAFTLKDVSSFYIAFNADYRPAQIQLPPQGTWKELLATEKNWQEHFLANPEKAPLLPSTLTLAPYSALVAIQSTI